MLAGIAAGNDVEEEGFYGVAPDAELIIVKLRQAKQVNREYFMILKQAYAFRESYVSLKYCSDARQQQALHVLNRQLTGCHRSFL